MKISNNILICPLEWGLGHATRMIPIARKLHEMNQKVFIGSGEEHILLFRKELPDLSYIKFPGFNPGYSRFLPQYIPLLLKAPVLLYHIIREHYRLKGIIQKYSIDIVISDNRFGLWSRKAKSVYITHMPLIPLPKPLKFLEFPGVILHRAVIKKYSLCFIPDLPGELNVSGRLSHGISLPGNVRYIGILSRFINTGSSAQKNKFPFRYNTVILSGPEPQREILKQKLITLLNNKKPFTVILEGRPGKTTEVIRSENITFFNHLSSAEMRDMISGSESIITRSGYSTIMELISLNCSALLIPTPGQTEQEYLAEYLAKKGWFSVCLQAKLKEGIVLPPKKTLRRGEILEQSEILLTNALKELLE